MKILRMWVEDEELGFSCLACATEIQKEKLNGIETEKYDTRFASLEVQKQFHRSWYSNIKYFLLETTTQEICDEGDNLIAFRCPRCEQIWRILPV
jgi:hypothetical protein